MATNLLPDKASIAIISVAYPVFLYDLPDCVSRLRDGIPVTRKLSHGVSATDVAARQYRRDIGRLEDVENQGRYARREWNSEGSG